MDYAYIRVAPDKKNEMKQLEELGLPLEHRFADCCSCENTARPALKRLVDTLQAGDIVHIQSLDRLSRTVSNLKIFIDAILARGATLRAHRENLTFSDNTSDCRMSPLALLKIFSSWQTSLTTECIAIQKQIGRQSTVPPEKLRIILGALRNNINCNLAQLSKEIGISVHTCYYYRKVVKQELAQQSASADEQ